MKSNLGKAAVFFTAAAVLAACSPQQKQPSAQRNVVIKEVQGPISPPDVVGNLGGRPVRINAELVEYISYEDTPTAFSREWETYKSPPRNYESKLNGFRFDLNMETGTVFNPFTMSWRKFYDESAMPNKPWVSVSIRNAALFDDGLSTYLDKRLARNLEVKLGLEHLNFVYSGEKRYGLERYVVPGNDPKTGKPWREESMVSEDVFIGRDKNGRVRTYIQCSFRNVPNPPCRHVFLTRDMKVEYKLSYSSYYLRDWQKLEEMAKSVVYGFVVDPAKSPLDPNVKY